MILVNPTDTNVTDYPIQNPKDHADVKLWSINSGQRLNFPDYVGEVLLDRYGFLQKEMTQADYDAEKAIQEAKSQGKQYTQVKIVQKVKEEEDAPATPVTSPVIPEGATNERVNTDPTPYVPEVVDEYTS